MCLNTGLVHIVNFKKHSFFFPSPLGVDKGPDTLLLFFFFFN